MGCILLICQPTNSPLLEKYLLVNGIPLNERVAISLNENNEFVCVAINSLCLIIFGGGEIDEERYLYLMKKMLKKENIGNYIKTLEDRKYIYKEAKTASSQTLVFASHRSLFEFTVEGICSYIQQIASFDDEKMQMIQSTVKYGFDKIKENLCKSY